jgi:hypothetical protein
MARYEQYAAKLLTSHEVFCNVHQAALLAEAKTAKCKSSKQVIDVHHVTNICVFIAFMMNTIRNPASMSP